MVLPTSYFDSSGGNKLFLEGFVDVLVVCVDLLVLEDFVQLVLVAVGQLKVQEVVEILIRRRRGEVGPSSMVLRSRCPGLLLLLYSLLVLLILLILR